MQDKEQKMIFTLTKELEGEELKQFLDICAKFCKKALLVIQPGLEFSEKAKIFLGKMEKYVIEDECKSEWPGTRLYGDKAEVRIYRLCPGSLDLIKTGVDKLYQWQQPDNPEDLCFLRDDNTPFFITIAHEHDSYLEITAKEKKKLDVWFPQILQITKKDE
jgi:hypothetical protein